MDINNSTALVSKLPKCDFCQAEAKYDAKTVQGPWAFMCSRHWLWHGTGELGIGYGQKLILE